MSDNELKDYGPNKAVVNATVQWPDMRLSEQIKHLRFFRDKENNIVVMPVVLFDPTQTASNVLPMGRVGISDPVALNSYARVYGLPCSGWAEATLGLVTHSTEMVQKGSGLEAVRTPTHFRNFAAINAGNTAVWTPAAGRRFRLMGGLVCVTAGCTFAAAAGNVFEFYDAAASTDICYFAFWVANAAGSTPVVTFPFDLRPNGYLSAAINQVLNANLNATLTAGYVSGFVFGTEEV